MPPSVFFMLGGHIRRLPRDTTGRSRNALARHRADTCGMCPAVAGVPNQAENFLETTLVIEARKGEPGGRELDLLIHKPKLLWSPSTRSTWRRREERIDVSARDVTPPA